MSKRKLKVSLRPEAREDIRNLPSHTLKLEAAKFILRLEVANLGLPLGNLAGVGDLSDCRKIYFDNRRYRIVYRQLPDERNPTEVDVIIVGPRDNLEVYIEAVSRLGRQAAPSISN